MDFHAHRVASACDAEPIDTTLGHGQTSGVELFDTSHPGRTLTFAAQGDRGRPYWLSGVSRHRDRYAGT